MDAAGSAYLTGTASSNFPSTPDAFDTTSNGGADAFMVKLNPAGSELAYATFLGGSGYDTGCGIAVDTAGSAYVTGGTESNDFPTTPGAFDPSFNGGDLRHDAFVVKLALGSGTTHAISGHVTHADDSPISGVSVSDGAGHSTTTGGDGAYTLAGIPPGTYTLTPIKSDHTFLPASRTVTVPPDAMERDFVGTPLTYSISGRVIDGSGSAIASATISDGAGHTVTTEITGSYTISGLAASTYNLTPSKSGYTFSPASRTVTVPPDATGQDFNGTPPPNSGLTYVGPFYLPSDTVMLGEADGRITTGDHVHLRLPFRNTGSQPVTDATVKVSGASQTGSHVGISVYNGASWLNAQQPVALTPSTIEPGETGIADFWIYVTDTDPIDRQTLTGQTWLQVQTDSGEWGIDIALSSVFFPIADNEALVAGSCLHSPGNFEIQKYAQYAAAAWTMSTLPTNAGDPDTSEQAIRNLVERVNDEFHPQTRPETRVADTALVAARYQNVGECRHYADLTTGLLRSLNLPARYVTAVFTKGGVLGLFAQTAGHAWVEAYLGNGGWRQADATWGRALDEGVYEARGWTVRNVWADKYPLAAAFYDYCVPSCYQTPVNCPSCLKGIDSWQSASRTLGCTDDVQSSYHGLTRLAPMSTRQAGHLQINLVASTLVTKTEPFTLTSGIVNSTSLTLNTITTTVAISQYVDSTVALFDVAPVYQVLGSMSSGQRLTVTWAITPLISGSNIPLRVSAESGDFFEVVEQPLVVNEPGTLPNLSLTGVCSGDAASPGQAITLSASVLDANLQPMTDLATQVVATVFATPTLAYSTTFNLAYCETCGAFQGTLNLPPTAPSGNYRVEFLASHPGYDPDATSTYLFVTPPLTVTLTASQSNTGLLDTMTLTVRVYDRGAVITDTGVSAEIGTPGGVVNAPLKTEGGSDFVLSLRPADLAASLDGQVITGTWSIEATVNYQGGSGKANASVNVFGSSLTSVKSGNSMVLNWTHVGNTIHHYEVFRSTNPYFEPGDSNVQKLGVVLPPLTSGSIMNYTDADVLGSSAVGYFYVVWAIDAHGLSYPISNRVGAFSFALTPGTQ